MLNAKDYKIYQSQEILSCIKDYELNNLLVLFNEFDRKTIIFMKGLSSNLVKNSSYLNSVLSQYIYDFSEIEQQINPYNIYIIYLATDTFSYEDFIKIRSNTFFSKKILINNVKRSGFEILNLINQHVLHNDIDLEHLKLNVLIDKLSEMPNIYEVKDNLNDKFAIHLYEQIKMNKTAVDLGNIDQYLNVFKSVRYLIIIDVLAKLILNDKMEINFSTTDNNFIALIDKKYYNIIKISTIKNNIIEDFVEKELSQVNLISQ